MIPENRIKIAAKKELYYWKYSYSGCFSHKLYDLIGKADMFNLERLRVGFPEYVEVWEEWQRPNGGETDFGGEKYLESIKELL